MLKMRKISHQNTGTCGSKLGLLADLGRKENVGTRGILPPDMNIYEMRY